MTSCLRYKLIILCLHFWSQFMFDVSFHNHWELWQWYSTMIIRTHALENQDWDEDLDFLMDYKYQTPSYYKILHCLEVKCNLHLNHSFLNHAMRNNIFDQHEYALALQEKIEHIHLEARRKPKETAERKKRDFRRNESPWSGPYVVRKKLVLLCIK